MIGLLGDAGTGKSCLLNAMADVSRLAKALDPGKSVTFVVTIYQRALPSQKKRFSAKVDYFDVVTIGKMLSSALDDWAQFHVDKNPDWTPDQREFYENRATTARSTFRAIFSDNVSFATDDAASAQLNSIVSSGAGKDVETRLFAGEVAKRLALMKQEGGHAFEYFEAHDQDALREVIDPLMTENFTSKKASLWPFVKQVTVGVKGSRVLNHFSLADLPGISDINQIRVKATQDHIDKCDELWVVARAGRIATDSVVNGLLQRYARVAFRGQVRIIATKVDENVGDELAMDMKQKGIDIGDYVTKKKSSLLMQKEKRKPTTQAKNIRGSKKAKKIAQKLEDIKEDLKTLEEQLLELVVGARNRHITQVLQQEKQRHYPKDVTPKVACISNRHYEAQKGETATGGLPLLSPEGTGIPGLRADILESAAPRIREHLEAFISSNFTLLMTGLELWAESSTVKGRKTLISIVKSPRNELPVMFGDFEDRVGSEVTARVYAPITNDIKKLATHAKKVVEEVLRSKSYQTLRAFIRRYGSHRTSLMADSWNELFSESCTDILQETWEPFLQEIQKHISKLRDDLVGAMDTMMVKLNKDPHTASLGAMPAFESSLNAHRASIRRLCGVFEDQLMQQLRAIYLRATSDSEENYMRNAILQAYEICQNDTGRGVTARWMNTFTTHFALLAERSPFSLIANAMQEAINTATRKHSGILHKAVENICVQIVQDFESMINQKTVDKSEIPVRQAVKEFLETANPEFERLKGCLEEVKARYPAEQRATKK